MRQVSETCKVPMIELYEGWGWDLYKRFGHAYDAFKILVSSPEKVMSSYTLDEKVFIISLLEKACEISRYDFLLDPEILGEDRQETADSTAHQDPGRYRGDVFRLRGDRCREGGVEAGREQ
eukprot:1352074-Amorphochlora_amoeboformis.AAC.3